MNQRGAIVSAAIVILLGISVVVTESGALTYLPEGYWLRFLQPMSGLLFAIAGFLSWMYYQITNNVFFKMLAISLFIHAGLTLESVLPVLIHYPLSMSGQLSVFQVVQMLHTLLQLTGSFLFAILLVYAIINYNGHERPLKREFLMALIVFIILYTAWRIGMLIWSAALPYTIDYVFMFTSSVLLTVIYFDGIRMALKIIKVTGSRLLKWLVAAMVLKITLSLSWIFPWIFFYSGFGTQLTMYYNYAIISITISIPILLLTALVACEKECRGGICS
ncbi:MAG: hypothetical protein WCY82_08720 [Desulfotomaculaceae bacterium]